MADNVTCDGDLPHYILDCFTALVIDFYRLFVTTEITTMLDVNDSGELDTNSSSASNC